MKNPFLDHRFAPKLLVLVAFVALMSWMFLPASTTLQIVAEKGPIENSTVFFWYLAMIVLWLFKPTSMDKRTAVAIQIVMMCMAARELDLHKALTGTSMLKARFWEGMTPLSKELEALAFLLPLLVAIGYLAVRYWPWLRAGVKSHSPAAWTVATFFAALVISKCADRSLGILKEWFGYHAADWLVALFQSIEEPFEMALPIIISVAVVQGLLHARQQSASDVRVVYLRDHERSAGKEKGARAGNY